jgi:DNA polymerase I
MQDDSFIYGKDVTEGVVSVECQGNTIVLFTNTSAGIERIERPALPWALSPRDLHTDWQRLDGMQPLAWRRYYRDMAELSRDKERNRSMFVVWDRKEAALIDQGITYYKGMRLEQLPVLSFDIETIGLEVSARSRVLIISNTFRSGTTLERRLFALDDYPSERHMLDAWCAWVREMNPALILGHNIYGYDLPYLLQCARNSKTELLLGRNDTALTLDKRESKFRRDASQFYTYNRPRIFGREVIDTFFLSIKYDVARRYESYGLKQIIKQEGLEKPNRVHYAAGEIAQRWTDAVEWAKIKQYAMDDADDALSLFDLMAPSYFYLCQSMPKTFEQMICQASGSQLNGFLLRSYLQEGHSIPLPSEADGYEGAISIGNPGCYKQCFKVDVASLYPSIMLEYRVADESKDPKGHFLRMVDHYTAERLHNKAKAKETGDRYFTDLEQAQKIVINSAYGMLGTPGLPFNSPEKAAFVTRTGREILTKAMQWAAESGFQLVNADTDSILVSGGEWTDTNRKIKLAELNSLYPARVRWEDDGTFDSVVVVAAKNYSLKNGAKIKNKGGSLKATQKEPALREFIGRALELLHDGRQSDILALYDSYASEIMNLRDIKRWCARKTYTQAVANAARTTEAKVLAAMPEGVQLGDKVFVYFDVNEALQNSANWKQDHCTKRLLGKLHDSALVFESVFNCKLLRNYALKREQNALKTLISAQF